MSQSDKAAFFSVAGSGSAIIASIWFVMSVFSGGDAWQGAFILMVLAYTSKSYAYGVLRLPSERTEA